MEETLIRKLAFDEVVEPVDRLSQDEQFDLLHLIHRRLAEQGRKRVAADVQEARAEFEAGKSERLDLDALADELLQ